MTDRPAASFLPPWAPATLAVHLGRPPVSPGGPVNPPVTLSSTFHQDGPLAYGRDGNPTWTAFEAALGGLEGGTALLFGSGMAAIAAVFEMLPVPGRVVVAGDAYNGTRRFLTDVARRGRLRFGTAPIDDTARTLEVCGQMTGGPARPSGRFEDFGAGGVLWLESPTNPLLAVADLPALIAGAHGYGMDVVVDNTLSTPLLQKPLAFGADVVVHSATKLLSGHSDVVLGAAVTTRSDVLAGLLTRRSLHGAIAGPWEAWLALRGLRTLAVRLECAQANAATLAERLSQHREVSRVRYPGLADDPGHRRAVEQMRGFGVMVSFEVRGGVAQAEATARAVRLITAGTSLGGVESLIERRGRWQGESGLPPALLRLSVGIEDLEDLWADLDQALAIAASTLET
ncbi:MAG: aminotransferase class I/II-fold pyridoxal phosphate-dependent enzyme [Actinomycetota bacterium]|nr:aminotransferase class I/II-fold pyridoxal phosphate-dependent enzyme [Actinomycetota bacterium]